jgi:hypothetical protein
MSVIDSLKDDIGELKSALLDNELLSVAPPDDLSQRQQLLIASFVILSHAHIEEFIEHLFLTYAEKREAEITDSVIPHCFVALSLHFADDLTGQGLRKHGARKICITSKNLYISKVLNINNGLKEANVVSLAKPLGLQSDHITNSCDQLFPALNTLGGKRGKLAHASSSRSASETIYAQQAIEWVEGVTNLIYQLVDYLDNES